MSVLKRKYNEEVPDSAKYKVPQASIPSRRTQIKITPDGKTSFGPNEIIRIMIPPQGYFDPEFSYLSFDIRLKCPSKYVLKVLEIWNSHSTAFMYDVGLGGIIAVGKGGHWSNENAGIEPSSITDRSKAVPVPFMRYKQAISSQATITEGKTVTNADVLFEWVPVGHIYPVLPFSSHGFFNRVVVRTANNTPIEDIQDYDYLCALMGQLMQSEGYVSTMGSMLEGWGDIRERAKLGLACVYDLRYCEPLLASDNYDRAGFQESVLYSSAWGSYTGTQFQEAANATSLLPVSGLSPEGVKNATLKETKGGVKLTCNLNLGLLQQRQNLPLLFSGGLILELYTAPFERCMSFTTIYSRIDSTDVPNLSHAGTLNGFGELVDITAMDCRLPLKLTTALSIPAEVDATSTNTGLRLVGRPLNDDSCFYYKSGIFTDPAIGSAPVTLTNVLTCSCAHQAYLIETGNAPGSRLLAQAGKQTLYQISATNDVINFRPTGNAAGGNWVPGLPIGQTSPALKYIDTITNYTNWSPQSVTSDTGDHVKKNAVSLENRYKNAGWLTVGGTDGWTYELANVELRADMVQFSQSYDESVAAIVDSDEGLPITFQTFSVQKLLYDGQRSTLTMNERARSIQFALAIFKDPEMERSTHIYFADNDSRYMCFGDFNVPVRFANAAYTNVAYGNTGTLGTGQLAKDWGWVPGAAAPGQMNNGAFIGSNVFPSLSYGDNSIGTKTFGTTGMTMEQVFVQPEVINLALCTFNTNPAAFVPVNGAALTALRNPPHSNARWAGSESAGPTISCSFQGQKFVAVSNPWRSFMRIIPQDCQSVSLNPDLRDYQFRIGTRFIPASPVDCSSGAVQAYIELMKAIGMYGSFSGDGKRALMPGIRLTPDLYSKRICTRDSMVVSAAYGQFTAGTVSRDFNAGITGTLDCKDYVGQRYRVPTRFVLGQNFSDIPDHAAGVDTATQALSVELALNGEMSPAKNMNVYVFLNVRRDMFIRCGGQIEILY